MRESTTKAAVPVAYLSASDGAAMLGVSVAFFRQNIAKSLPALDFANPGAKKRLPRWSVDSLRSWAERRGVL
jgi:hypothetical protein